jgi:hypothetical protein
VDESRAYAASYRNVDFEGETRLLYRMGQGFGLGVQGEAEYATTRKGSVADQSRTVSWLANSWQAGPFVQFDLERISALIRKSTTHVHLASLMATAGWSRVQDIDETLYYQGVKDSAGNSINITATLPRKSGSAYRAGIRLTPLTGTKAWSSLGADSYAEMGFQATDTRNVIGGMRVTLAGSAPVECYPTLAVSMQDCIKNQKPSFDTDLEAIPVHASAKGPYWDINLTYKPYAPLTFTVASSNGYANIYVPANAPANQAFFSIPLSMGIQWSLLPNLTIGPAWNQYFFRAQQPIGSGPNAGSDTIRNHELLLTMKWYFSRRTAVPPLRQPVVSGPTSVDGTGKNAGNAK